MMRFFNIFFYTIFIAVLLGIAGLLVGSMLPIPGNIEIKIVKSGSMEPNIPTGSVVIVKPETRYLNGDVITFGKDTKTDIPTTHRIIASTGEGTGTTYTTKGDANEEQDPTQVVARDVIGKVVFALPYAGFILDFARQPLGFGLLIGVPAALVILEESLTIFKEARAALRRRKRGDGDDDFETGGSGKDEDGASLRLALGRRFAMDEIFVPMWVKPGIFHKEWWHKNLRMHKDAYGTSTALVLGLVFMSTLFAGASGGTIAYFSDIERSIGNIFQAGVWADPHAVVLNEFLPNPDVAAGGFNFGEEDNFLLNDMPLGEWVELYNNSASAIDLAGWYVWDASGSASNKVLITASNTSPASTVIPANGFLVVYFNKAILNNDADEVRLYNGSDVLLDSHAYDVHALCSLDPTPGALNDTAGAGGACEDIPPNKSYARIPDGTGAWVDPVPTPGAPNIPDSEPMPTPVMVDEIVIPLAPEEGEVLGAETEEALTLPVSTGGSSSASASPPPTPEETAQDQPMPPEEPLAQTAPNEPVAGSDTPSESPALDPAPEPTPEPEPTPAPEPTPEPVASDVPVE